MPVVEPVDRPLKLHLGTEAEILWRMVDFHRATLLMKCEGLDEEDLARRAVPPSSLSLLGLVRHSTQVEQYWFERVFLGLEARAPYSSRENSDGDFDDLDSESAADAIGRFLAQCEVSREVARTHQLEDLSVRRVEHPWWDLSALEVVHPAAGHRGRLVFRLVHDDRFGGEEQRGDRGGVLQG